MSENTWPEVALAAINSVQVVFLAYLAGQVKTTRQSVAEIEARSQNRRREDRRDEGPGRKTRAPNDADG